MVIFGLLCIGAMVILGVGGGRGIGSVVILGVSRYRVCGNIGGS